MSLTYNAGIFEVASLQAAREIILTPGADAGTDERWERETPYLAELLGDILDLRPGALVIDYGCGIGRVAKALIERFDCKVLGVDASAPMRAMAPEYVSSAAFSAVSRHMLEVMLTSGLRADAAISVWVLQHAFQPDQDVRLIKRVLRPGAPFGLVNLNRRAVPTHERRWHDDGKDVRVLVAEQFNERAAGALDRDVVGAITAEHSFWALYVKSSEGV
jgi:SAM-dependent methyltransferase